MPAPDYTAWCTVADIQTRLTAAGVSLDRITENPEDYIQSRIDEVTDQVKRVTKREFVAASETRVFDGSGLAEQPVDEMVTLTSISVLGPLYDAYGDYTYILDTASVVLKYPGPNLPKDTLVAGVAGLSPYARVQCFPLGRQNIQVTGAFGYASEIPRDLWGAVADEVTYRLSQEAAYQAEGRIVQTDDGDYSERRKIDDADMIGGTARYNAALEFYTRKGRKRVKRHAVVMV